MSKRFEDFNEVREQSESSLLDLLRSGDGPERVWAAWALGLRLGEDAVHLLAADSQPDPGVRAHLVVVLAGFGERDALRALADSDPDATVRANACDYLIRTAGEDQVPATCDFLRGRLVDDPRPEPRIRVLRRWPHDCRALSIRLVGRLLSDPAPDLRLAVIEHLGAAGRGGEAIVHLFRKHVEQEDDFRVILAMVDLVGASPIERALVAAAARMPSAAPALLQTLRPGGEGSTWESLASLTNNGDPRVHLRIIELCRDWSDEGALGWLGSVAESGRYLVPPDRFASSDVEKLRRGAHYEARALARRRILALVADPRLSGLERQLVRALRQMLAELETELDRLGTARVEYLGGDGVHHRARFDELVSRRAVIRAALRRSGADTDER